MDLSFSGAGFMGCYYFGVIDCWNKYIPRDRVNRVAGASAGSLIAAYYLLDLPLDACLKAIINMTEDIRRRPLGVFDRSNQIVDVLPRLLERIFPEDAHKRVSGRLHVVMTRLKDMKKVTVNEFETNQDLIDALNCSCFIPVWSGNHVSTYKGVKHIDGGFSDNLPVFDEHTIRVCCFAGATDISPYDRAQKELLSATVLNMPIYFTLTNMKRGKKALFPPSANQIVALLERGFQDTKDFILSNDLIQCQTCYSSTKPHEQPIYLKKSPIITPSVSPALSRSGSHLSLCTPAGPDCQTAATAKSGNEENQSDSSRRAAPAGVAKKRAPSLTSESEASSQELQSSFNMLLAEKLREEKNSQQNRPKKGSKRSKRDATDANNNNNNNEPPHEITATTSNGKPPPIIVIVDEPNKQESTKQRDSKESSPAGSPDGERKKRAKEGEKPAKVPPPAALSEKLLLRRGTIQMDPQESLKIGLDKFTLAPNPLPSCPPSPNLNRHCTQCISMRQEARMDLVDEKIRREVDKYRTTSPVKQKFTSKLVHPIKWFRQLGVKSSYRFEGAETGLKSAPRPAAAATAAK